MIKWIITFLINPEKSFSILQFTRSNRLKIGFNCLSNRLQKLSFYLINNLMQDIVCFFFNLIAKNYLYPMSLHSLGSCFCKSLFWKYLFKTLDLIPLQVHKRLYMLWRTCVLKNALIFWIFFLCLLLTLKNVFYIMCQ